MCVDPRAHSKEKLVPPEPLPALSRRALRRVKNPLPAPKECPYCESGGLVKLVHNSEIYGREYGDWPYAYLCQCCRAYVGVHPGTDIPLGTLADKALREARKKHKPYFNEMIHKKGMGRSEAYEWLANKMNLKVGECHWAWFDWDQCVRAGMLCRTALEFNGRLIYER